MSITIQLNGDALSKLIDLCGGDKFVLKLRKGVMENVFGNRVKALAKDVLDQGTLSIARAEVARQIGEVKKNYSGHVESITLTPEFLSALTASTRTIINDESTRIRQHVEDTAKNLTAKLIKSVEDRLESTIRSQVDRLTEAYIKSEVTKRFNQALNNL